MVSGKMEYLTGQEEHIIRMEVFFKGILKMVLQIALMECLFIQTELFTEEIFEILVLMAMECWFLKMGK